MVARKDKLARSLTANPTASATKDMVIKGTYMIVLWQHPAS